MKISPSIVSVLQSHVWLGTPKPGSIFSNDQFLACHAYEGEWKPRYSDFMSYLAANGKFYRTEEDCIRAWKRKTDTDAMVAFLGWERNRRFGADGLVMHRVGSILIERQ